MGFVPPEGHTHSRHVFNYLSDTYGRYVIGCSKTKIESIKNLYAY